MSTQEFVSQLAEQGILIQVVDGELKIKGPQSQLNRLVEQIRERKAEIIEYLTTPIIQPTEPAVSDIIREYTCSDGRVLRLSEEEFGELVEVFKTLHYWKYGHFIP